MSAAAFLAPKLSAARSWSAWLKVCHKHSKAVNLSCNSYSGAVLGQYKHDISLQNAQISRKLYCYSLRWSIITQIHTCTDDSLWWISWLTFWTWCLLSVCTRAPPLPVHSVFCTSRTKCAGWRGDSTQPKSSWCLSAAGVRRTAQLTYQRER